MIFIAYTYTHYTNYLLRTILYKNNQWFNVDVYAESILPLNNYPGGCTITDNNHVRFHDPETLLLLYQCDNLPEFETWVKQYYAIGDL